MQLAIRDDIAKNIGQQPAFEWVQKLDGAVYRSVANRRTLRFELNGKGYFLKWHGGIGWKEVFKNLSSFRMPIWGAGNEWAAINRLTERNIPTMRWVGFGARGWNPAQQESFIITDELAPTISLEDLCRDWVSKPPPYRFKTQLIRNVASLARDMHHAGVNHRDFYICHILWRTSTPEYSQIPRYQDLHIIDLHRAAVRKSVPYRWLVKDVGSLYFSAMDCGLSWRDLLRFIRIYSGGLKRALQQDAEFWRAVEKRALALYAEVWKREPPKIKGRHE
ncbi:MAG TPA: lipopolysaccharide core heptose(I) kinase RfaP [Pseudomonadales bacterium]|nr:lipopolysaccharide core heptose(I) kinase RfaP [Pseudomonadales bacterium]